MHFKEVKPLSNVHSDVYNTYVDHIKGALDIVRKHSISKIMGVPEFERHKRL